MKKHTLILAIFTLCAVATFAFGGGRSKEKGGRDSLPREKGSDRPPRMEKELTTITGTVTVDAEVITITSSEVTGTELEVLSPPDKKYRKNDLRRNGLPGNDLPGSDKDIRGKDLSGSDLSGSDLPGPEEFDREDKVEPTESEKDGNKNDDTNSKKNLKHRQRPPKPVTEKELSELAGKNVELKGFYTPSGKFIVLEIVEK